MPLISRKTAVGQPSEALVAVDERMVLDDRMQQRGCFGPDVRVGVLAEGGRLRASDGRPEQTDVSNRCRITEQGDGEVDDVIEVEELDRVAHSPSRRKASL